LRYSAVIDTARQFTGRGFGHAPSKGDQVKWLQQ